MSLQQYSVLSAQPIAISPSGFAESVTVVNTGTNAVLLSDQPNGLGYSLNAGNPFLWKARTPLHASVAGGGTTIMTMDTGDVLPVSNITTRSNLDELVNDSVEGPINSPGSINYGNYVPFDTSKYQTLLMSYQPQWNGAVPDFVTVALFWGTIDGAFIASDIVTVPIHGNTSWRVSVKGPRLTMDLQFLGNIYQFVRQTLTLYGSAASLPDSYFQGGDGLPPTIDGSSKSSTTTTTTLAPGASANFYPGHYAGPGSLMVRSNEATATGNGLELTIRNIDSTLIYSKINLYSTLAFQAVTAAVVLPQEPIAVTVINRTTVNQNYSFALTYAGA